MIVLMILVAATGCLVVGVALDEIVWTTIALGLATAVLAATAASAWSSRLSARRVDSSSAADSEPSPVEPSGRTQEASTEDPAGDATEHDGQAGDDSGSEPVAVEPGDRGVEAPGR